MCELKRIAVLILLFLVSSVLAVVVGSNLSSAADVENEPIISGFLASPVSGESPFAIITRKRAVEYKEGEPEKPRNPWSFP